MTNNIRSRELKWEMEESACINTISTATSQLLKATCHKWLCTILTVRFPHHVQVLLALVGSGEVMGRSRPRNPQLT